ncbi:SRPBCC domain-containing protein [Mesorhizobium sp. M9A.F.Ca.ET.002.03.1.2]|uniref:SRPBCC family protein n=1 Tax=Mesorhizobium sp. M9A.F.Ca.ET.002.03.1.2 TaxID=2493668 RepID=UPI000F759E56|nr:SRPBCC domain-containing protein [Mesorhizobium sp. M9A.F.Ca.ET.002.03.1.2]AZO01104.1 SRPBCC domain-containing protein [Mesorhizobium sp. M9A.F.Ca.ET.002.03.1.2]
MDRKLVEPDVSDRPHDTRVERVMSASCQAIYRSFTTDWEGWFALEGALIADPVLNGQLFFVVEHEGKRHPHYGRFLTLEPDRKVELTWLTGTDGTQGAETVLSVDLEPRAGGCTLTLIHRGFYDQEHADHHGKSWEQILAGLDKRLTN